MDSGNSGSLQSSSGGEEEYDSRAESISTFLNHHTSTAAGSGGPLHHHPPPPHLSRAAQQHHHSSMFDPLSNYFDPLSSSSSSSSRSSLAPFTASSSNPNSLLNLDMVWSKGLRSEPNCTDLGGLFIASSSSPSAASSSSTQQLFTNHGALHSRAAAAASTFQAAAGLNIPQGTAESAAAARASVSGFNIDQANIMISSNNNNNNSGNNLNMARPKKRSRASRRAPTTVLTTDTTNFRAMVQEFTGIPAPPFTSSPFPRTRLDLFGTSGSSLRSTQTHLDSSQPSYLLRPFAQKLNPIPFVSPPPPSAAPSSSFSSSSMIDAIASTTATNIASGSATAASNNNHSHSNSTSINYQLPSDLGGLLKQHQQQQPQNLLSINMQSPILNLQSFLNPPPKYPLNASILETKPQGSLDIIPSSDSHLKIGVLDELGLSHHPAGGVHHHLNASLGGLQNIVSSEAPTLPIRSDHQNNPTGWPPSSTDGTGSNENDQGLLRSISSGTGNYSSSQRVVNTNGKVINNFMPSPSSSDFHHHHHQNHRDIKGQAAAENVTTRSEGMVESWICSSD